MAIVKCAGYDPKTVLTAVDEGIGLLGGINEFCRCNEKILLKPNLLAGEPPEKCVTTHPAVFQAVAKIFSSVSRELFYGDSPAFQSMESVARKSGIAKAALESHVDIADFITTDTVFFEQAHQNKKLFLARGALEADGIISISKLKTHGFARMTGAIKNQFGCVPGLLKSEFHAKLPDLDSFSKMLVDINLFLKPRLYIMDGIMAMEGNGPRGGTPRPMNVLLFSRDPVALDSIVCRMIGLEPERIPTVFFGNKYGLGTCLDNEIETVGESWQSFVCKDYKTPINKSIANLLQRHPLLRNRVLPRPVISPKKCVRCGICADLCPVEGKALTVIDKNKPPIYDYQKCIRCYCCQELCPEGAITIKAPLLGFPTIKN